jgi:hypothetical protein
MCHDSVFQITLKPTIHMLLQRVVGRDDVTHGHKDLIGRHSFIPLPSKESYF